MNLEQLRYLLKYKREELASMVPGSLRYKSIRRQVYYLYYNVKRIEKAITNPIGIYGNL